MVKPPTAEAAERNPQEVSVERMAREIRRQLKTLALLGTDAPDVASQLAQAALTQASGHLGAALDLVRDAQNRLDQRIREVGDQRIAELEARDLHLLSLGVSSDLAGDSVRIRADFNESRVEEGIRRLDSAFQRLSQIEADWRGLLGLLRQIETTVEGAHELGLDLADVQEVLTEIHTLTGAPPVNADVIDRAAQSAARALMLVNEMLPTRLREELDRHQAHLSVYPSDHAQSRQARVLHAEVSRHLRSGRLPEATMRLRELRQAIRELGGLKVPVPEVPPIVPESTPLAADPPALAAPIPVSAASASPSPTSSLPPPVPIRPVVSAAEATRQGPSLSRIPPASPGPTPPVLRAVSSAELRPASLPPSSFLRSSSPSASSPPPSTPSIKDSAPTAPAAPPPEAIGSLMQRARGLAIRVRSLPPESPIAEEAAREIRTATELLRARELAQADAVLTRLMSKLDGLSARPGVR
ncbi:MAG TPA: hypothetical protein VJS68_01260 [Thermoplasmata archaeon]|nr:hypothetical protein [Thermoplasmata archaeon]